MQKEKEEKYDLFISHASEDKKEFVKPLVEKLILNGYKVWYDEFTLKLGDSLFNSISKGIKNSKYGIIVLSKNFFNKKWTKRELEALISKEFYDDADIILPIWLNINQKDVYEFSPMLVDKLAVSINKNDINIAFKAIENKFNDLYNENYITDLVNKISKFKAIDKKKYILDMENRIKNLFYFSKEFDDWAISNSTIESTINQEQLERKKEFELLKKYNLPINIDHNWEYNASNIIQLILKLCKKWVNRSMSIEEAAYLEFFIEDGIETDPSYILYGITRNSLKDRKTYRTALTNIYKLGVKKEITKKELAKAQKNAFAEFYGFKN